MLRGELRCNEPMGRHTSWRAGGSAARAYVPADLDDMRLFLGSLSAQEPVYVVGLGSNLLVRDGGLRGTVIFTHGVLKTIRCEGDAIYAEAGVPSPKLARFAAVHELVGAEFMAGIPGTVGGALAMNAGCYGGEAWAMVESVTTVDRSGQTLQRTPADYEISYRHVKLLEDSEEWFAAATFRLARGDGAKSRTTIKQLLERRIAAQPLNLPNAGSIFRNPPNDHAARLIEACGLKGRTAGGAVISDKHANFIVNTGGARAADIEALIELAHGAVKAKFDVELEREVRILGEAA
ncbi:MAG TPA: UDP-N-acetylmuramate dehydrogenase, partial [Burkholderiales bacterium]|nr:UDP-N-acetylmuramate dehydrogenase [Burkholderiales bacterium]